MQWCWGSASKWGGESSCWPFARLLYDAPLEGSHLIVLCRAPDAGCTFRGGKVRTIHNVLRGRRGARLALATAGLMAVSGIGLAADVEDAIKLENDGNSKSVQSQKRIDKIADQTDNMAAEFRAAIDQTESLKVYNAQLQKLLDAQNAELASLDEQVGNVTVIGREVTPLMLRMVTALEQFIELDVPLLLSERRERVANLRELMDRADVANSEKYRRIMEAYQIENEYGRTIESYQDTLEINGEERTLDFLRVGRIALLFQTLDGKEVGAWDQSERAWIPLPSGDYRDSIKKGIRIAQKQAAPDLVRIPVSAPEDIQ